MGYMAWTSMLFLEEQGTTSLTGGGARLKLVDNINWSQRMQRNGSNRSTIPQSRHFLSFIMKQQMIPRGKQHIARHIPSPVNSSSVLLCEQPDLGASPILQSGVE